MHFSNQINKSKTSYGAKRFGYILNVHCGNGVGKLPSIRREVNQKELIAPNWQSNAHSLRLIRNKSTSADASREVCGGLCKDDQFASFLFRSWHWQLHSVFENENIKSPSSPTVDVCATIAISYSYVNARTIALDSLAFANCFHQRANVGSRFASNLCQHVKMYF